MTAKTSFGQWLKQRRKAVDLTREDLAGRIGCAAVTLYKIETGERRPSKQIAELLAEHLNIPANERPAFVRFARGEAADAAAPWGTPFHHPTNLPVQPTLLIGRDEDVATIRRRLLQPESRLLTLIGPPGIGKTRLALQVAAEVLDDFTDSVFFVELAPIIDASLVSTTIANTLGIPDRGPQTPLQRLKAFLRDKQTLLVLDNFEQILAASPDITELLAALPLLKVMVTSRAPLRIRQERQVPVSPLALPDLAHLPDVESVTHYSAIMLFLERAQAVKSDFALTHENAPSVAAICARLDGLPLAIELTSARVKLLPPAALLERLHGRLLLQSDGLRDIEPRHRTLNAAIEWSYQLLSVEEQTLFRRLGVFVGGWTLEAAEAVCLENLNLSVLDGLTSLLDKSLIKQVTVLDGEPRFMMLETVREYALEQLAASGETDDLHNYHANYFAALAERTETEWYQIDYDRWMNILKAEYTNFQAALTWIENGLPLALALRVFWWRLGHYHEASDRLANALMRHVVTPTRSYRVLRASACRWLGIFLKWQGYLTAAQPPYEESLALYRELKDAAGIANTLGDFGMLLQEKGEYERAGEFMEESVALHREMGNTDGVAWSLFFLGTLAYGQNKMEEAGGLWEESLLQFRSEGHTTWGIANALAHLAMVALDQNNLGRAGAYLVDSLNLLRKLGERWQMVHAFEVCACLAAARGQPSLLRSARLFGAAEILRETIAAPVLSFQRQFTERGVAALRAQLDNTALVAAWAEGRAMTLEQTVAYALDQTG